jgi:hypothetical protein
MKYLIYYTGELIHREQHCKNHRELEKWLTEMEGKNLSFKEEPEAGAVFFKDASGKEIGFYQEET